MSEWDPRPDALARLKADTIEMRSSNKPHWREVREKLREEGITPQDAAVADWEQEGPHVYFGTIGTRDERLFRFSVIFGYDRHRRVTHADVGYVESWKPIPPEDVGLTPSGQPNSWLCDAMIARRLLG